MAQDGGLPEASETAANLRQLQTIFEAVPDGIVMVAADGIIERANPAALRMLGLERLEPGTNLQQIADWPLARAFQGEPCRDVDVRIQAPHSKRVLSCDGQPIRDELGNVTHAVWTLRYSQSLPDAIPQLVWTATPEGVTDYVNQNWIDYTGLSSEQSVGQGWATAMHPDDLPHVFERWEHSTRTGEPFEVECRIRRGKDGPWRWHLGRALLLRDSSGAAVKWCGTFTDIDGQKCLDAERASALAALRESELRFTRLVNSNLIGVSFWEMDGSILEANDEYLRLIGRTREELEGRQINWHDFNAREYAAADAQSMLELRTNGVAVPFEKEYVHRNGRRVPVLVAPALLDIGRNEGVAFSIDLTQRKEIEHALRQSNQDLQQFAFVASHDLQEPLRMITTYSQMVSRRFGGTLGADGEEFLGYIIEGAMRMNTLIRDLLEFSRLGFGEMKPPQLTDLSGIVQWVEMNLQVAIRESGATITWTELPTVSVDQSQMTQLFQNLISNSIKYRGEDPPRIQVAAERQGDDWVISASDNGCGFQQEYAEQIFVVFKRLHGREFQGSGIGLAICKRIVERHGGRIWAKSTPGDGATFYFTLPAD